MNYINRSSPINIIHYLFGLKNIEKKNVNTIAPTIPAPVKLNMFDAIPISPMLFAPSKLACDRECPKLTIGTSAPPPTTFTILSYIPPISNTAPIDTNMLVICPAVNFVLSNIICAIKHITPQNKNEYKYFIMPPVS